MKVEEIEVVMGNNKYIKFRVSDNDCEECVFNVEKDNDSCKHPVHGYLIHSQADYSNTGCTIGTNYFNFKKYPLSKVLKNL